MNEVLKVLFLKVSRLDESQQVLNVTELVSVRAKVSYSRYLWVKVF